MTRSPSRPPASIYITGLFAMGYTEFYTFLIPLYGLSLGMSAGQIGMLVGGRSLLAVFLSIHIGVLMDRFGTRRVTLFFVWTAMALAPVFPLVPWFWPLLLLQIVNGAAYLLGAAWGAVLTIVLLRAPEADIAGADGRAPHRQASFRVRDVVPRLPDYLRCFALMAIPAVATTMAIIFLRTATNGVQSSLYVVYLKGVGLTGTSIGILFAAIEVMSGFGSLFAGRVSRLGDPQRTMLSGTVLSIVLICLTPFLGGIFLLLLLAQAARGWLQGVVQPMMFSVQAKAVGRYRQGSVVGLRQTMNRLAAIVIPPVMGMIADRWGAGESFVILGSLMLLLSVPVALITRRATRSASAQGAESTPAD